MRDLLARAGQRLAEEIEHRKRLQRQIQRDLAAVDRQAPNPNPDPDSER